MTSFYFYFICITIYATILSVLIISIWIIPTINPISFVIWGPLAFSHDSLSLSSSNFSNCYHFFFFGSWCIVITDRIQDSGPIAPCPSSWSAQPLMTSASSYISTTKWWKSSAISPSRFWKPAGPFTAVASASTRTSLPTGPPFPPSQVPHLHWFSDTLRHGCWPEAVALLQVTCSLMAACRKRRSSPCWMSLRGRWGASLGREGRASCRSNSPASKLPPGPDDPFLSSLFSCRVLMQRGNFPWRRQGPPRQGQLLLLLLLWNIISLF